MNQHKNTFRLTALLTVVAIILGIYVFRLQNVQIAQAKAAKNVRTDTYTYYTRVTAARGALLDCKGKVLIGNRALHLHHGRLPQQMEGLFQEIPRRARMGQRYFRAAARAAYARAL